MNKILFPTDFSETADNAFEYALALAKDLAARVDLLNIYHLPFAAASDVPVEMIQKMLDEKKENVQEKLEGLVERYPSEHFGQTKAVNGVFISQEITDIAKNQLYELIVMGTKGEHNRIEKILGSITTHTMMQAPCPVLAVPEGVPYRKIRKIAYATDFHLSDEHAVEQLMSFAGTLKAEVHFVHVTTDPEEGSMEDLVVVENHPFEFTYFTVVNNHSVMGGLDRYIQEKNVDMLALFIPRRRLWERLFHTSFTKRMTFHTKTPLLVFHG